MVGDHVATIYKTNGHLITARRKMLGEHVAKAYATIGQLTSGTLPGETRKEKTWLKDMQQMDNR